MVATKISSKKLTPEQLRQRLSQVLANQRAFQKERLEREQALTGKLDVLQKSLTARAATSTQRIGRLRELNKASKLRTQQLAKDVELATPVSAIANELAALRELSERARSDPSLAGVLTSRSQAAIGTIAVAAAQVPGGAKAVQRPAVRAAAAKAQGQAQHIEDEGEEEQDIHSGQSQS